MPLDISLVGTTDPARATQALQKTPLRDAFTSEDHVRADRQMVRTVPGDQAFQTLKEGGCPLVKP